MLNAMIEKFKIKDFKSYKEADLHISPLSILIGANASGKSNVLEALRLLNWLAQGQKLSALQYQINEEDQIVRGFINHLPRFDQKKFTLGCSIKEGKKSYHISLTIGLRNVKGNWELHFEHEECSNSEWLYRTKYPSERAFTEMKVEYNNFSRGGRKPQVNTTDQQVAFVQLSPASFEVKYKKEAKTILTATQALEKALTKIVFLDPTPKLMHGYSFKSDKKLLESGKNISAVLYNLIEEDANNKAEILQFIKSLPEQQIEDISFIDTSRGEVLVQLHEAFLSANDNKVDAGLLSDGTLRALAIVAALLSAESGSLVIIEEIDNGIHPSRVKDLMERINELAKRRELSVLITSHNPTLLNASPNETIDNVQFCYRDKYDGCSKITQLQDIKDYPELIAQDELGNLLTRGLIDEYVKDETSKEEKIKKSLDWLKQFRDE
ncbi:ATP-binding protein [Puteibacter caeruleilacunae]|nr:ATP-binding protein [Puteibacter caeruleilacunae]